MAIGESSFWPVSGDVSNVEGDTVVTDDTTNGVILLDDGTTDGDPFVDLVVSRKSYPPGC